MARSWNRSWPALLALLLALAPFSNIQASDDDGLTVVGMDVTVELRPEQGLISETARLTLQGSSGPVVRFRLNRGLQVERSRAGSGSIRHSQTGDTVSVTLTPPLQDEQRTITLELAGRPRAHGNDRVNGNGAVLGAADHWIPALPHTAAAARLEVVAPAHWTVLASGEPQPGTKAGAHRFRTRRPVRSLGLAAGPALVRTDASIAGTPLRVAGNGEQVAEELAALFADPLTWLSGTVVPYPFEGVNLAFVPGLERTVHAAGFIAVPADRPVNSKADGGELLSPLWFGEYLAGDGPWMDGLAAWQAVTYARDRGQGMPARIGALRDRYLSMSHNRDVAIRRADQDTPEAVVRGKGSAAWEMVRATCGNRHFKNRLDELAAAGLGGPVRLADLRTRFVADSSEPVEAVFEDWFDRTGLPALTTELHTTPTSRDEWRTDLSIRQQGKPYTLTLDVVFHGAGQIHREAVRIDRETTRLLYILPFQAIRVELDPLGRIYKQPTITRKR